MHRGSRADMRQLKGTFPVFLSVVLFVVVLILCSVRNTSYALLTAFIPRHYDGRCILSPTRSCQLKRMIAFSSLNEDDYGEDIMDSPKELKKAVNELSRLPNRQSSHPNIADSVPNLEGLVDPTADDSLPIDCILGEYPEYPGRVTEDDSNEDTNSELDGWFLDTEEYVNSRNHLNPDGSLDLDSHSSVDKDYQLLTESLLRMQRPNVPASFLQHDKEPTLESLLQQPPQDPSATSEELHRKVFEQEDAYLQQSEIFRKSLTGDSAASLEAAQWRRGADYRHRQEEAIANLNHEMDAFLIHLEEDESRKNKQRCFKCGCALSPEEVEHTKSMQASQRLCSICYGDLLVAKSDRSFFRDAAPLPFRQGNQPARRAYGPRQYRTKIPGNATAQNVPGKSRVSSAPRVERQDKTSDDDDIEMLKKEVKALQDELHHLNEGEVVPDAEEATGTWSQVIDPDTGEVFYWNDETEEMRWEKEE